MVMEYLQELVDRTWRIAWSCAPLVLLAIVLLRREKLRPVIAHALALGAGMALLVPLLVPIERHVFDLPGDGEATPVARLGAWLAGVVPWWFALSVTALLCAYHLANALAFRRRIALFAPVSADVQSRIDELAREIGLRRAPRTAWCPDELGPLVRWGLRRHLLLLPRGRWSSWSPRQREAVLLHELAHLRRSDGPARGIWAVVTSFYWWNPLVWLLGRRSDEAAEIACDRWATQLREASRETYARTLLALAAERGRTCRAGGLHVFSGPKRRLGRRLLRILHEGRPAVSTWGTVVLWSTLLTGLALTAGQTGALETRHRLTTSAQVDAFLRSEPDAAVRRVAVDAIGNRGAAARSWAAEILTRRFASEPSSSVRYEILDALERLEVHEGIEALLDRARNDPSRRVRDRSLDLARG